ncbi:MAG TPA: hypothetical protein VF805_10325, partial [Anaeromyxobacteraceae bacterium]
AIGSAYLKGLQTMAAAPQGTATSKYFVIKGSAQNVAFGVADVASVAASTSGSSLTITFTSALPSPTTVGATSTTASVSLTSLFWNYGTDAAPALAPSGTAGLVFSPTGLIARAIWNINLLNNDGSGGLHNPTFAQTIQVNTQAKLGAGPQGSMSW